MVSIVQTKQKQAIPKKKEGIKHHFIVIRVNYPKNIASLLFYTNKKRPTSRFWGKLPSFLQLITYTIFVRITVCTIYISEGSGDTQRGYRREIQEDTPPFGSYGFKSKSPTNPPVEMVFINMHLSCAISTLHTPVSLTLMTCL